MSARKTSEAKHNRKRLFQPSISSFLYHNDRPELCEPQRSESTISSSLPLDTQASLLSVGMRVRKSVPEGYKTHKTLGAASYFPSTTRPCPSMNTGAGSKTEPPRELQPLCGLHKVGGWATQPPINVPSSSAPSALLSRQHEAQENSVPGLTMSQSTIFSTQSSFSSNTYLQQGQNKKRTYEEEIEDDLDAFFDEMEEGIPPVQNAGRDIRVIAKAKTRSRMVAACTNNERDFEDAVFLNPPDAMDFEDEES